jgi:aldose 1-epimerase
MPDRSGKMEDIVLGYDSLKGYLTDKSYFGAIVGRCANRIGKGRLPIEGKVYQVTINVGNNQLHGGKVGFNSVLWDAKVVSDSAGPSLELTYVSRDGEEGYPGTVTLSVTYTLTDKNELRIVYRGSTDATTVLNPSHHSYFNLTGSPVNTILDHEVQIDADSLTPVDEDLIPTGKIMAVESTPMDFRKPIPVGARINEKYEQLIRGRGYDHNWVLRGPAGTLREAAIVYERKSGRVLTVLTDQPGIQFYTGNFLDGSAKGKGGIAYQYRTGLCLEAQHYPDSPNNPGWPSIVLHPGEVYHQTTVYQFSTR